MDVVESEINFHMYNQIRNSLRLYLEELSKHEVVSNKNGYLSDRAMSYIWMYKLSRLDRYKKKDGTVNQTKIADHPMVKINASLVGKYLTPKAYEKRRRELKIRAQYKDRNFDDITLDFD